MIQETSVVTNLPIEDEALYRKLLIMLTYYCASEKKTKDKHKSKHHKGDRHLVSFLISNYEIKFSCFMLSQLCIIWIFSVPFNPWGSNILLTKKDNLPLHLMLNNPKCLNMLAESLVLLV